MEIVQLKCETANVLEMLDLSDNCLKGDDVSVSVSDVCLCETIVDGHHVNIVATHRVYRYVGSHSLFTLLLNK